MDSSPLTKLPAEIRNHIYELVLYSEWGIMSVGMPEELPTPSPPSHPLALALCCRQLHHECIRLFYNLNTFWIQSTPGNFGTDLETWTNSIGETNAAALDQIRLVHGVRMLSVDINSQIPNPTTAISSVPIPAAAAAPAVTTTIIAPSNHTAHTVNQGPASNSAPEASIADHLMTLYLNIRNNTTIRKFCRPGSNVYVFIAFWVDDRIYTQDTPFIIILDCAALRSTVAGALQKTLSAQREIWGCPVPLSELRVVHLFLVQVGRVLADILDSA